MKKAVIFILTLLSMLATVLFVACSPSNKDTAGGDKPHAHMATAVAEKIATCEEGGYSAHYKCDCGKLFSDALASNEILLSEISTPTNSHNHTKISFIGEAAGNCVSQGVAEHYSCGGCNKLFSDASGSNEIFYENLTTGYGSHKSVKHNAAVPTTCILQGTLEHYFCDDCMQYSFSESFDYTVSADELTDRNPPIHINAEFVAEEPSSCTVYGIEAHWYCSDCFQYSKDESFGYIVSEYELRKTEYGKCANLTMHNGTPGSCSTEGTADYYECNDCFKKYLDESGERETYIGSPDLNTGYDYTSHTSLNKIYGIPADCRTEGSKDYWECTSCWRKYLDEQCTQEVFDIYYDLLIQKESHSMAHYALIKPSCQNGFAGNYEYWYCSTCMFNYSDPDGWNETYDLTYYGTESDFSCHTEIQYFEEKMPTCVENGHMAHFKCSCGIFFDEWQAYYGYDEYHFTSNYEMNEKYHNIVYLPAKAADCLPGNIDCHTCEYCHKYYTLDDGSGSSASSDGYIEISESEAVIPATGRHSITAHPYIAPTCTEQGISAYFECTSCNKLFWDEGGITEMDPSMIYLEAKGHNWGAHYSYKESTCIEQGNIAYSYCSICEKNFDLSVGCVEITGSVLLPLADHKTTFAQGYAATCEETGIKDSYFCSVCEKNFESDNETEITYLTIAALGHSFYDEWTSTDTHHYRAAKCGHNIMGEYTEHDTAERTVKYSTCIVNGTKEIYCPTCAKVTSTISLPFADHVYKAVAQVNATCKTEGTLAHYTCSTCTDLFIYENGEYVTVTADSLIIEINPDAHKYGGWTDTEKATCQKEGNAERVCSLCGNTETTTKPIVSCNYIYVNVDTYYHSYECEYCHSQISTGYHSLDESFTCTVCKHSFDYTSGLIFSVTDGEEIDCATLTGAVNVSGIIKIPAMYGNAIVTGIAAEVFKSNTSITEVYIPETVTIISESAFNGCTALTAVYFEGISQCTEIGASAFVGCSSLSTLEMPSAIKKIGSSAFSGTAITELYFTALNILGDSAFENCKSLETVVFADTCNKLVSILSRAFAGCTSLNNLTLHNSLTTISESAFQNSFREGAILVIPESVTNIYSSAFMGTKLKEVTLNGSLSYDNFYTTSYVEQHTYIFSNSVLLEKVTIGKNVDAILPYMFNACYSLTTLVIEDQSTLVYIGDSAFKGTNIQNYNLTLGANFQYLGAHFAGKSDFPYNYVYYQPTFNITFADASQLIVCKALGTNRVDYVCTEITETYWKETGYDLIANNYHYVSTEAHLNSFILSQ